MFISLKLGDEWLTVYPLPKAEIAIKIGQKKSQSLSFFTIVVPLGLALITLRELEKFDKLIDRLNVQSNERLSTILEAFSAARYKKKGYDVELEPFTDCGHAADFRVRFEKEWIYFECKKEYPQESKYFKNLGNHVNMVIDEILRKAGSELPFGYRFDVILSKRVQENTLSAAISKICESLDNHNYDRWYELDGIKFAINSRLTTVALPPLHVRQAVVKVGTTATKIAEENFHIQVIYNPFGNKELQKVRRILNEASNQLPRASRGIIILETTHSQRMIKIAEEKLKTPRFSQVIDVLVTGNGAWSVPNPRWKDFPLDFLKIAAIPN